MRLTTGSDSRPPAQRGFCFSQLLRETCGAVWTLVNFLDFSSANADFFVGTDNFGISEKDPLLIVMELWIWCELVPYKIRVEPPVHCAPR